jgi:hypothetical protein
MMTSRLELSGKLIGGNQWARVISTATPADEKARQDANKAVFEQPAFKSACEAAGVAITKRQASKWNNGKGAAYNLFHKIEMNGFVIPNV